MARRSGLQHRNQPVLSLPSSVRVYLCTEATDMRKGFDGLSHLVRQQGFDLFGGHLFVFVSRRRDRIKILTWDRGGFVLYYKRLERGRFKPPAAKAGQQTVRIDPAQLTMLLDGIDYSRVRRPIHWEPKKAK